jgi:hypothetical protein
VTWESLATLAHISGLSYTSQAILVRKAAKCFHDCSNDITRFVCLLVSLEIFDNQIEATRHDRSISGISRRTTLKLPRSSKRSSSFCLAAEKSGPLARGSLFSTASDMKTGTSAWFYVYTTLCIPGALFEEDDSVLEMFASKTSASSGAGRT